MGDTNPAPATTVSTGQWFEATHWSIVLAAGQGDGARRAAALDKLCRVYWEPLYAFVRRSGCPEHDAQDLTQSFFAHLLSGNHLQNVAPDRGKFRSYLLAALKNFRADQHDRACAAKRGGGQTPVPLDAELAESHYAQDSTGRTAESLFDRRWALTVLHQALARLREEFVRAGKEKQFAELSAFLSHEGSADDYAAVAGRLQMSPGAVPVAVHRLRLRYREAIRTEVAHTVSSPAEVDQEMRYLLELLCQG
jgi:RNA polymerase sigma-70 factor (ECF subfamily)